MAIEIIATVTHYQGLQADFDELTDSDAYPNGSIYHVVDTGYEFVRFADGWLPDLRRARAIKLAEML